jgi:hypothetical protein
MVRSMKAVRYWTFDIGAYDPGRRRARRAAWRRLSQQARCATLPSTLPVESSGRIPLLQIGQSGSPSPSRSCAGRFISDYGAGFLFFALALAHMARAALRAIRERSAFVTPRQRALPPFGPPFLPPSRPQARMIARASSGRVGLRLRADTARNVARAAFIVQASMIHLFMFRVSLKTMS